MRLYTKLFGENPDATALLGMIGLTRPSFERYRDAYLNKYGTKIIVLARIGGGNTETYREVYENMKSHPYFIKAYDDNFDETYAYFEFSVPEKYKKACKMMAPKEDRLSVGDMFHKEVKEAEKPDTEAAKRMEDIAKTIMDAIENGDPFIAL